MVVKSFPAAHLRKWLAAAMARQRHTLRPTWREDTGTRPAHVLGRVRQLLRSQASPRRYDRFWRTAGADQASVPAGRLLRSPRWSGGGPGKAHFWRAHFRAA